MNSPYEDRLSALIVKEKQERLAAANITTEILAKLNVSVDNLPTKSQQLIEQAAKAQYDLGIENLDPLAISLRQSREMAEHLDDEYEILILKEKNLELQTKINRNKQFIDGLKRDLQDSKESLAKQNPNPDNIQDSIRQLKLKVNSYQVDSDKAKAKLTRLSVPDSIYPASLQKLMEAADAMREEAAALKLRADDITLAKEARDTINELKK